MDGLMYFSRIINPLIGTNMSSLFGMENVWLKRTEIYVNKSKGIECTYNLEGSKKWSLGKFVLDHLKKNHDEVCHQQKLSLFFFFCCITAINKNNNCIPISIETGV
jgi:hypothetical protein